MKLKIDKVITKFRLPYVKGVIYQIRIKRK